MGGLSEGAEEAAADAVTTTVAAMPGRVRRHTAAPSTRTGKRAVQTVAAHEQVAEHYRRKIRRGELHLVNLSPPFGQSPRRSGQFDPDGLACGEPVAV